MTIRITCGEHRRPHRVIEFEAAVDAEPDALPWREVPSKSFPRDRRLKLATGWENLRPEHRALMDDESPEFRGKRLVGDTWYGTEADEIDPDPQWLREMLGVELGRAERARDVFPIKCDRCQDGRYRRAERLYPVLDALRGAGRAEVTIREFWAVADAMDSGSRR